MQLAFVFLLVSMFSTSHAWLSVSGNKIVDGGSEVLLQGLNWFGYETAMGIFHGLWAANLNDTVAEVAKRGFNVFRVPVSADLLHNWSSGKYEVAQINSQVNPEIDGKNNREVFSIFLDNCKKNGIKVFIDVHGIKPDSYTDATWGDTSYLCSAVEWFAGEFKNDDTIIGIDIKNEPHGQCDYADKVVWDSSTANNNWKHASETCASAIHGKNSNLLIFVEGIECYNGPRGKESGWWGGVLSFVKDLPPNITKSKLVYSPHEYGPTVFNQSWFQSGFSYDSLMKDHWKDSWMFIHDDGIAPLLIGEWGGKLEGTNKNWMEDMVQLISKNSLSHTFWCLNPNSGDTQGLLKDDWVTWDEEKYKLIKPALTGKLWK